MSPLQSAMVIALAALMACAGATTVDAPRTTAITTMTLTEIEMIMDDVPKSCPITKPPDHPFIPPAPYPAETGSDSFWFGNERLWTMVRADGTWKGLPHYTPDDPTFRQKLFWWRQGYNVRTEPQPKLTVTGTRLGSSAPPLVLADRASNGWVQADQPFMVVGINLPTLGCWKITAHYKGEELSFIVWVAQ